MSADEERRAIAEALYRARVQVEEGNLAVESLEIEVKDLGGKIES